MVGWRVGGCVVLWVWLVECWRVVWVCGFAGRWLVLGCLSVGGSGDGFLGFVLGRDLSVVRKSIRRVNPECKKR